MSLNSNGEFRLKAFRKDKRMLAKRKFSLRFTAMMIGSLAGVSQALSFGAPGGGNCQAPSRYQSCVSQKTELQRAINSLNSQVSGIDRAISTDKNKEAAEDKSIRELNGEISAENAKIATLRAEIERCGRRTICSAPLETQLSAAEKTLRGYQQALARDSSVDRTSDSQISGLESQVRSLENQESADQAKYNALNCVQCPSAD
jgi:peptidoglycan hydrolase CwlO-like protein